MCEICEWGSTQDPKLIVVAHEVEDETDADGQVIINWPWRA